MANAIIIAALAGIASAMLAAAAMSGPGLGLFFVIIAPLPLMIVAIRWQPLLAVLGGALTAAALAFFIRSSAAVSFSILVTLPAFITGWIIWSGRFHERQLVGVLCLSAGLYAVFATLVGAFSISFDYATLEATLMRQAEAVYRFTSGIGRDAPLTAPRGQDPQAFIRAYAAIVAPVSCVMLTLIFLFNTWLAAKIAHKSSGGTIGWIPVYSMQLPRLVLTVTALSLLGGMLPGYPGLILELIGISAVICIMALGYAAVHHATLGTAARGFALGGIWLLTLFIGLPAIFMLFAGIAELAFGWREKLIARRNS
jgi:hypothetical protein